MQSLEAIQPVPPCIGHGSEAPAGEISIAAATAAAVVIKERRRRLEVELLFDESDDESKEDVIIISKTSYILLVARVRCFPFKEPNGIEIAEPGSHGS